MISKIKDTTQKFQVIWDLGRRCTYSCSYCSPNRNNKHSPLVKLDELKKNIDSLTEYIDLMGMVRTDVVHTTLSFTGGEPTIHPDFFKFLEYIKKEYPQYATSITTNGVFGGKILDKCLKYTDTGTISYHAEGTSEEKDLVLKNIRVLCKQKTYKVNVMFHKDYFDECVELCNTLRKEKIPFVPRIIGDQADDKKGIERGWVHVYTDEQMAWFKNFWKKPAAKPIDKNKGSQKELGRPCCGNRRFDIEQDGAMTSTKFLSDTNFHGWNCLVNWYFLYINQEFDYIWSHQTCGVNLKGDVAPLGKLSEFDQINDELSKYIFEDQAMPLIRCPKKFCGCGMCITKANDDIGGIELFNELTAGKVKPILMKEKYIAPGDEITTAAAAKAYDNVESNLD